MTLPNVAHSAATLVIVASIVMVLTASCYAQPVIGDFAIVDRLKPSPEDSALAARLGPRSHEGSGSPEFNSMHRLRQWDVLRAGLRLPSGHGRVFCAMNLDSLGLDTWEQRRKARILSDEIVRLATKSAASDSDPDPQVYAAIQRIWASLDDIVGPREFLYLLQQIPEAPMRIARFFEFRQGMRDLPIDASCIPALLQKLQSKDMELRIQIWHWLSRASVHDKQSREDLARALWAISGMATDDNGEPKGAEDSEGQRLPLWLRRSLHVIVLQPHAEIEDGAWFLSKWIANWLVEEAPSPQDLQLLVDVAKRVEASSNHAPFHGILLNAIRRIPVGDAEVDWDSISSGDNKDSYAFVLAARAAKGDSEAEHALLALAPTSLLATAVMFDTLPGVAQDYVRTLIQDNRVGDLGRSEGEYPSQDLETVAALYGLQWDPELLGSLSSELLAPEVSFASLSAAYHRILGFKSREVATAMMARLEAAPTAGRFLADAGFPDATTATAELNEVLTTLDLLFPDRLRSVLRTWAEDPDLNVRNYVLYTLLQIGDPKSGPMLIRWIAEGTDWLRWFQGPKPFDPFGMGPLLFLQNSDCEEVRKFIESLPAPWDLANPDPSKAQREDGVDSPHNGALSQIVQRGDGLRALAVMRGIPFIVALTLRPPSEHEEGASQEQCKRGWERLRRGDAKAAYLDILGFKKPESFSESDNFMGFLGESAYFRVPVGSVDHSSVREAMLLLRKNYYSQPLYWWATTQLAIMNSPEARAEIFAALQQPHYLQRRVSDPRLLLEGLYPGGIEQAVQAWMDNPKDPTASFIVHRLTDLSRKTDSWSPSAIRLRHRRIFDPTREHLVRIDLTEHYIAVPR